MSLFGWVQDVEELTPAALTVLAQLRSPNDNGTLVWDTFMPRRNVDSVRLADLTQLDFRPAADRRGWNQRGRRIPLMLPNQRNLEMEPIEANFKVDEREMQTLSERFIGNQQLIEDTIGVSIPTRTEGLADADYRRLELDVMEAWTKGTITGRDPETGEPYTAAFNFAAYRQQTATTAYNDPSVNAFDNFISWLRDALAMVGPMKGVALRYPPLLEILKDAPTVFGNKMSLVQLADRISQDTAQPFQFYLMEEHIDVFPDGGINTVHTKKWPDSVIAAIPQDGRIGNVAFAPVARAQMLSQQIPEAGIDIRGTSVFTYEANGGRDLNVECQLNALPLPDENRIATLDTGVHIAPGLFG